MKIEIAAAVTSNRITQEDLEHIALIKSQHVGKGTLWMYYVTANTFSRVQEMIEEHRTKGKAVEETLDVLFDRLAAYKFVDPVGEPRELSVEESRLGSELYEFLDWYRKCVPLKNDSNRKVVSKYLKIVKS